MSWLFPSGGQSVETSVSASVLPVNIQDWFPLRLTGFKPLLSKRLSRVFSVLEFESISSLVLSLLYGPTLTSIHDYWKISSVQSFSRVWFCDPMDCSKPGFPVHHYLIKSAQTHAHWVSDTIQPSYPLSSPSPPAYNPSQHQGISNESVFCIR